MEKRNIAWPDQSLYAFYERRHDVLFYNVNFTGAESQKVVFLRWGRDGDPDVKKITAPDSNPEAVTSQV